MDNVGERGTWIWAFDGDDKYDECIVSVSMSSAIYIEQYGICFGQEATYYIYKNTAFPRFRKMPIHIDIS
jgi:hypothetical protein